MFPRNAPPPSLSLPRAGNEPRRGKDSHNSRVDALRASDHTAPRPIDRPSGAVARLVVNALHIARAVAVAVTAG
ncbi:hypothetical protein KIK06_21245 [Nocardiopsis sp. EMB25]|uniref:hypothetical protein n=1 Tax=Nocardiopsis sp. EMB25 TaxID=2835867 RepID=UPI002283E352|nr:hypothetical protein [Nocardiopsis sp. EMB25]MCY9786425.1 hypothetical protein [Nocardiopsis sp. EMB25]